MPSNFNKNAISPAKPKGLGFRTEPSSSGTADQRGRRRKMAAWGSGIPKVNESVEIHPLEKFKEKDLTYGGIFEDSTYSVEVEDSRAKITAFMDQRCREDMEDSFIIIPDFDGSKSTLVAVFDGHFGSGAARFCTKYLHRYLLQNPNFAAGKYKEAFTEVFLQMDRLMRSKAGEIEMRNLARLIDTKEVKLVEDHSSDGLYTRPIFPGTTALVVLLMDDKLVVANAGDCHCTLFGASSEPDEPVTLTPFPITRDHNLDYPGEETRVKNAGGYLDRGYSKRYAQLKIPKTGRDCGVNVTRGLGDIQFKMNPNLRQEDQMISAVPDVFVRKICSHDKFLVVASDGMLRDSLESSGSDILKQELPLSGICSRLAKHCADPEGDNITTVLLQFKKVPEDGN